MPSWAWAASWGAVERPGRGEADRQVAELGQQLLESERAPRGHREVGGRRLAELLAGRAGHPAVASRER